MNIIRTFAALYFEPQQGDVVPAAWFDRVRRFLEQHDLSVNRFSALGRGFTSGELSGSEALGELANVIRHSGAEDVTLYCLAHDAARMEDWRATAAFEVDNCVCYLGVDSTVVAEPARLLRQTYELARGTGVRYGIAYKSPLGSSPELYAVGETVHSLREVTRRFFDKARTPTRLQAWANDLRTDHKYADGYFRGAYPASLVSTAHIDRADLRSWGIGTLSLLDGECWVWELDDLDLTTAERLLEQAGALIL